jgi:hypothetical protein
MRVTAIEPLVSGSSGSKLMTPLVRYLAWLGYMALQGVRDELTNQGRLSIKAVESKYDDLRTRGYRAWRYLRKGTYNQRGQNQNI